METYTVADNRTTETYMIPGASSNPPTFYPQLEEISYMGNEALPPEFIVDQGIYYPAANYYGYYSPGFESFGELDDQNRILGSDGQENTHYSQGLPNESLPYAYYTPNYGYPQSPYNPYNPYIPGAVVGPDGSYIGGQQYVTNPSYQLSAYIPLGVQPGTEVPNGGLDPSMYVTSAPISSVEGNTGLKNMSLLASGASAANSQRLDSVNPTPNTSLSSQIIKASEGLVVGTAAHMNQVRNSSGLPHSRAPSVQNPQRVTLPSNDNFSRFGSNARGWVPVDKVRPRVQFNGSASNPTGGMDSVLGEQNKGPRTNRSKVQLSSAINGATPTRSCGNNAQGSILIDADQYNRDDFHVNYPNAKFFVIKSYSEDDVHKSIKYNVWSSTPNGNRKLDSAYEDAKRISSGNAKSCPVFLFFSVNASGQFCGVSEMTGPVDFHKDMDIWQQDKWMGSFPVKWHMIKDVPNTSFRHIILENNENKPVTNSRDTQEIPYLPGISMLNIFKSSPLKTSLLDDFEFYEERERILQTEKARILGRIYDPSQFVPAVLPLNRTSKVDKQADDKLNDPPRADDMQPNGPLRELKKPDGKQANDPPRADEMQPNGPLREITKPDGKQANDPPRADEMQPNGPLRELTKPDGKQTNDAANHTIKPSGNSINGAVHSASKSDGKMTELLKSGGKPPGNVNQTLKTNSKSLNFVVADRAQSKPAGPKSPSDQPPNAAKKSTKHKDLMSTVQAEVKGPNYMRNSGKPEDLQSSSIKAGRSDEDDGTHKLSPIKILDDKSNQKAWIQTIGPKGIASRTGSEVVEIIPDDVVTVGSVRIKVNGSADSSSSSIISLGPVGPKGSEK